MSEATPRPDSGSEVELTTTSTGVAVAATPQPLRQLGGSGRLRVELAVVGRLALASLAATALALLWIVIDGGGRMPALQTLAKLAVPQFIALAAIALRTVFDLPAARWERRGRFTAPALPYSFLLVAPLLWPVAIVLWWRDRTARRQPFGDDAMLAAHARLARAPYGAALRCFGWSAIAFAVDLLLLAAQRPLTRTTEVALLLAWWGGLAVIAALLASSLRAVLRPEVLTIPVLPPVRPPLDLRVRLLALVLPAGLGAVVGLAGAAMLVGETITRERAVELARDTVEQAATRLARGDGRAVGRMLAQVPGLALDDGSRRLGRTPTHVGDEDGAYDGDDDGRPDVYVRHVGEHTLALAFTVPESGMIVPVALAAALAAIALGLGAVPLAHDLRRDARRAQAQLAAVSQGRAAAQLSGHALATAEMQRLVSAVERLLSRITESNVEKYVAIEKSKEADRLKSQFLANMSHDLRSPLNSILGFSELLLSGIDGQLAGEQREIVETIYNSGRELLQEIDDILDAAKIDAGRLELHAEPTPPATLVARAVANATRRTAPAIEYDVDVAPTLPPAFVDPYRTVQALENVLAFAATRVSRGRIGVKVQMSSSGRRRVIAVEIRTPVAPASAAQLTAARRGFHRIPGHRGLGLSLPIAGSIVELQGGALAIRESSRGMVFRIELRALELRRTGPHKTTRPGD
ncbi:MAG: HAMP domain-containing histidine kinase [Nannocystaceae bacterium]|nr:HAMP domain-containing histidine kinase [Nannocystaceae bacterium]